jgi:hypothetical protein
MFVIEIVNIYGDLEESIPSQNEEEAKSIFHEVCERPARGNKVRSGKTILLLEDGKIVQEYVIP